MASEETGGCPVLGTPQDTAEPTIQAGGALMKTYLRNSLFSVRAENYKPNDEASFFPVQQSGEETQVTTSINPSPSRTV